MKSKYLNNIDPAFKECFEIKEIEDRGITEGPLLKKAWVMDKLRLLNLIVCIFKLFD